MCITVSAVLVVPQNKKFVCLKISSESSTKPESPLPSHGTKYDAGPSRHCYMIRRRQSGIAPKIDLLIAGDGCHNCRLEVVKIFRIEVVTQYALDNTMRTRTVSFGTANGGTMLSMFLPAELSVGELT